jgi:hypothetical protein
MTLFHKKVSIINKAQLYTHLILIAEIITKLSRIRTPPVIIKPYVTESQNE